MKLSGVVKKNKGRGKKLGFPTANLDISENIADGIYVGTVGPMELPALIFVGVAETFGEKKRWAEVHILDFDEDIYGRQIEVRLLKKLRRTKKFGSDAELIAQMKEDERQAREYFAKPKS